MADDATAGQQGEGDAGAASDGSGKDQQRPKKPKRKRTQRSFPAATFEDSLALAEAIQRFSGGAPMRRLTLFDQLGKSPESGPSRQLITNSSKYGLTSGSYAAEHLELTEDGRLATGSEVSGRERAKAHFRLAIEQIPPFKLLYETFSNRKLPTHAVMKDTLTDAGYDEDEVAEAVDTFIGNAKYVGLLQTISGAERLLTLEHILEELPRTQSPGTSPSVVPTIVPDEPSVAQGPTSDWSKVCFYVTPIGEDDSDQRQHSDLFLESIVAPALDDLEEFDLTIVRADQIGKPGMISAQIIEHIANAALVIADLSFHNPNVFYEVGLRHAARLPIVQIIRESDRIPFDLDQLRTIRIDTSSIYSLVPRLETYRSQIANQVRRALADDADVDNPLTIFYPKFFSVIQQSVVGKS